MNIAEEANDICARAESALRVLMQKAIETGEYRHLPNLARMAEQLNALGERMTQPIAEPTPVNMPVEKASKKSKAQKRRSGKNHSRDIGKQQGKKPALQPSGHGYPKFQREDDWIIKIGWSKNLKSEYQHRAPKKVVDALVKSVLNAGANEKVFSVDELMPIADPEDGTAIPGYQVYIALAWLRTEGLLQQHGREGYSLFAPINMVETVEKRWSAIPGGEISKEAK